MQNNLLLCYNCNDYTLQILTSNKDNRSYGKKFARCTTTGCKKFFWIST